MKFNKKKAKIVQKALASWHNEGVLTESDYHRLSQQIKINPFDWQRLARYSFVLAIISIIIALSTLFFDNEIIMLLSQLILLNLHPITRIIYYSLLAILSYVFVLRYQRKHPEKIYSNEALLLLPIILITASLIQLGYLLYFTNNNWNYFFTPSLLAVLIYGIMAWISRSKLTWLLTLIMLGTVAGAETSYLPGGAYLLHISDPLHFAVFGLLMLIFSLLLQPFLAKRYLDRISLSMSLLYLFLPLWILSIFGHGGYYNRKIFDFFFWSLIFASASAIVIYLGLKKDDGLLRGFGLVFLFINLYTRYFEFFWVAMNKAIFFSLLGISLYFLGRYAEKIWLLGKTHITTSESPPETTSNTIAGSNKNRPIE